MKLNRKRLFAVLAGVGILAGSATIASASIPDSDDGEFHVCVQTNRSVNTLYTMFVMDPALQTNFNGHCNTGYTEYTLNQRGPAGPAGPAGPKGDPGTTERRVWMSGVTSIPAPSGADPAWYEKTVCGDQNAGEYVVSGGVDFVWGGTDHDHSELLRSAPIAGDGNGDQPYCWQFIFRRPQSGSYSVRMYAVIESGG